MVRGTHRLWGVFLPHCHEFCIAHIEAASSCSITHAPSAERGHPSEWHLYSRSSRQIEKLEVHDCGELKCHRQTARIISHYL